MTDHDPVTRPAHYRWLPGDLEVIDITEGLGFCMGNVVKYVLRADHKGAPVEDLKKARWYLDREIARREGRADELVAAMIAYTDCVGGRGRCGRDNCVYCAA